jgi:Tol biopolymer transport system component
LIHARTGPSSAALASLLALALASGAAAAARREPVLKQVALPHSYYWRELYLPQLTTGPSAVAFTPDGTSLVYSMAGSLWLQRIGADDARELTHAAGAYDYQPEVTPDGANVFFSRYDGNAIELWRLDLASGRETPLTSGGDVNVEPRVSPDGRRLAWVSTRGSGRFNLFVADLAQGGPPQPPLVNARALLAERRSAIERYYYSPFDHAINPSWSPDGTTLYYVGNPEVALGTGDLWSVDVAQPGERRRILAEETSWSARPERAPAGPRLLYSSYRGRASHQLWLTTAAGTPPLPLTFGDFDLRNARWSPDGRRIAAISNEGGNTSLVLIDVVGGARRTITASTRHYLTPRVRLTLDIADPAGSRTSARVAVLAADRRAYAPDGAWMHADDGFDRAVQATETHYFHCAPPCTLELPPGPARIQVQHGFAVLPWEREVEVDAAGVTTVRAQLVAHRLPREFGAFVSADLHVHMNYGGHYRHTPASLARQAEAEDLDVVHALAVNKEERIPDIGRFRADADPASTARTTILHAQEFHTSFWGHLGLLHLSDHFIAPDFAAYAHTAMASPWPHNGVIADLAHAQGALVGYVHPFDWRIEPDKETSLSNALPADVLAGKVDYIEVVGFSDHKATAEVWYRLLNLGFRLAAGAGTDAMANYASLRGPIGLNRVYLDTAGARDPQALRNALKAGRTFATNGPLLGLRLGDTAPGDTLALPGAARTRYRVAMRSPVPVDHLELVMNGRVVHSFRLGAGRRAFDAEGEIAVPKGGWALLRAWNDGADPRVFDLYPYATTSPVWLEQAGGPPPARADAEYFAAWLEQVQAAAQARTDFNDAVERRETLEYLGRALRAYREAARSGRIASGDG